MAENLLTKFTITDLGMALISRGMSESKAVNFTKVTGADGISSADPTKVVAILGANKIDLVLAKVSYNATDQTAEITATLTNNTISANTVLSEYGIFAKCAGDTSEVLFGYKNNKDTPDVLYPSTGGNQYIERVFKCNIGSFSNVGDAYVHNYNNDKNVGTLYFQKILKGLLGVAHQSFNNSLPDSSGDWGWFDGGEIKKTDYPDLWLRVKPDVDTAVDNVTSGVWEYLGSTDAKSYFGWYKGTTDDYFRKPNVMESGHYMRPTSISGRKGGVHQVGSIQSHTHGASSATAGSHNHTGTVDSNGYHTHTINYGRALNGGGGGSNLWQYDGNYATSNAAGEHNHTFTTNTVAAHNHTVSVDNYGGTETTPANVAVRVYGLLRL